MGKLDLPRYKLEEYEQITHENNQQEDIRVRKIDDNNFLALDLNTELVRWGPSKEKAVFELGKSIPKYNYQKDQGNRSETIVETDGVLGGDPRVDGTRIGIIHIHHKASTAETLADIAAGFSGFLTLSEVEVALNWIESNPDKVSELERERELLRQYIQEEWNEDIGSGIYSQPTSGKSFEEWKSENELD